MVRAIRNKPGACGIHDGAMNDAKVDCGRGEEKVSW